MNIFLKAKHWQLFIFIFAIPVIGSFFFIGYFLSQIDQSGNIDPMPVFSVIFPAIVGISILSSAVLYFWQWAVAIGLQKYIPNESKMNTWKFKVTFIIPIVYMILIFLLVIVYLMPMEDLDNVKGHGIPWILLMVFPIHFFIMFCTFYVMFFMAKTMKLSERPPFHSSGDWGLYFVLIWFYFVGVWILQPKINKIVKEGVKEEDEVNTFLSEK